jgi:Zn-dependent alcohol dehydrogenase
VLRATHAPLELKDVRIDDPGPGEVNEAFARMRKGEEARQVIVFD